jgi:hypothetical protein
MLSPVALTAVASIMPLGIGLAGGGRASAEVPAADVAVARSLLGSQEVPDLPDRGPHPDLVEIDGWLQTEITSLEELRGQVIAVQFWTFNCDNWLATLDHVKDLYARYHDQGLEIVGIHSPETDPEAELDNIVEAVERLGVTWPVALDTSNRTFHSWQAGPTAYWPRIYLLDRRGHIRYDHVGEGRYAQIDAAVQALLAERS